MKATREQRRAKEIFDNTPSCIPDSFKELYEEIKKAEEEYTNNMSIKELLLYEFYKRMRRNQLIYGVPYEPDFTNDD